ncbi:fungal hydrophobin-domain-containing protein [Lenzites betulinus]|nr:fungal hydrophobin-domain-containing protein [Lenzites betulinus]
MFARLPTLATVASLAIFAIVTSAKRLNNPPPTTTVTVTATPSASPISNSCSAGDIQCCKTIESASSDAGSALLGLLGVAVQGDDVLLGLNCTPITVIGAGGASCNENFVCCENNNVGGMISIGCVPVILS